MKITKKLASIENHMGTKGVSFDTVNGHFQISCLRKIGVHDVLKPD